MSPIKRLSPAQPGLAQPSTTPPSPAQHSPAQPDQPNPPQESPAQFELGPAHSSPAHATVSIYTYIYIYIYYQFNITNIYIYIYIYIYIWAWAINWNLSRSREGKLGLMSGGIRRSRACFFSEIRAFAENALNDLQAGDIYATSIFWIYPPRSKTLPCRHLRYLCTKVSFNKTSGRPHGFQRMGAFSRYRSRADTFRSNSLKWRATLDLTRTNQGNQVEPRSEKWIYPPT